MSTHRISRVALALLSATAFSAAGAQDDRLASRFDGATLDHLRATISAARDRNLPVAPLIDKAMEGATKHAPGPRIEAAVDALYKRLETSREALAPSPTDADVASGADALAVGVPRDALRSIRALRPRHSVAVPLAVLAQLVSQGVPVPRASNMVEEVLRRGATAEQLVALNDKVRSDVAAGLSPEAALDVRMRGLTAVLAPPGASGSNTATDALAGASSCKGCRP